MDFKCFFFVLISGAYFMSSGVRVHGFPQPKEENNHVQMGSSGYVALEHDKLSFASTTVIVGCNSEHGLWTAPIETLHFTRLTSSATSVCGTAYDPVDDKLYWSEWAEGRIARSNSDGSNAETFFTSGVSSPFGLEIDVSNRRIYWSNSGSSSVESVKLDGQDAIRITSGVSSPRHLSLDNGERRIYWSEAGNNRIGNANLDGSDRRWVSGLSSPFGLLIKGGKMYHTQNLSPGSIISSGLLGEQQQELYSSASQLLDLDIYNDDLYYISYVSSGNMLFKMAKDGSTSPTAVGSGLDGFCSHLCSIQIITPGVGPSPLPSSTPLTTTLTVTTNEYKTTPKQLPATTDVNEPTTDEPATTQQGIPTGDVKGLNLYCKGTSMTAVFNTSLLPFDIASDVHLFDSNCVATGYGRDWAVISTDFHKCQTEMKEFASHMVYRNALILGPDDPDSFILPLQKFIECRIERRRMADVSFSSSIDVHVAYGNYTFNMSIFHDETYSVPYTEEEYPIDVKVGDEIFLGGSVVTVNELDLFIDSCWATPSPDPRDNNSYSLIENGCATDTHLAFHDTDVPHEERFSFRAFAFRGNNWLVFIHCQMLVCDVNTLDSRCAQGCIESKTRKKSTSRDRRSVSDLTTVSSGPLVVRG